MKRLRIRHYLLALFLLCFITYASSFINQFVWDDEQFIYKNEFVKNFDVEKIFTTDTIAGAGETSNYYRPLTTLSFAIDHAIWGLNPFGFHLTNTSLHAGAGLLLFLILIRLKIKRSTSFIISSLFLVHPLQTEAVTYMNSRGDSQYTFFLFLGLYAFLQFLNIHIKSLTSRINWGFLAWFCYLFSILSKEIGIAGIGLYFLVTVYDQWQNYVHNSATTSPNILVFIRQQLWQSWGWFALYLTVPITIFYLILRSTVLNFTGSLNLYQGSEYGSSLFLRLMTFFKVWQHYIGLLLFPHGLHMDRNVSIVMTPLNTAFISGLFLMISVTIFGFYLWRKHNSLQLLFGWAWFLGMLVPVSGVIPINGIMYEHWLYVPQIGFWLSLAALFDYLKRYIHVKFLDIKVFQISKIKISVFQLLISIVIVSFCALTIRQNYYWSTPIRLYTYLIQYTQTARIYNNLAMAYAEADQPEQAIVMYQKSLTISDSYPQTYHNLANTSTSVGDTDNAEKYYLQALKLSPNFYWSRLKLSQLYADKAQYDQAIVHMTYLSQQFPGDATIQDELMQLKILSQESTK